jgi:hypothetical protein
MVTQKMSPSAQEVLVKAAILAPSMHNTQPWRFRFHGWDVEVYKDTSRELAAEDAEGRLTMIGVGAAIFNVRVAAAALGWSTATALLPDPRQPTLAARLTMGPRVEADADGDADRVRLAGLSDWLPRRRTNRQPFADRRPIPPSVRKDMAEAAASENATLEWVEDVHRIRWLLELAADADFAEADEPQRLAERQLWVGGQRDREGVPSASLGPRPTQPSAAVRDLAVEPRDRVRAAERFEERPVLAVLLTNHDSPQDWLTAGQALQRVLVVAATHGVAASFLNQPIEHKDLRWLVRDPRAGWTAAQAILRLGYGPEVPPTPRRSPEEFLLEDDGPSPSADHGDVADADR